MGTRLIILPRPDGPERPARRLTDFCLRVVKLTAVATAYGDAAHSQRQVPCRTPQCWRTRTSTDVPRCPLHVCAATMGPRSSATGFVPSFCSGRSIPALRLARWAGERTWREPLVLVLHVAFAFVPLG